MNIHNSTRNNSSSLDLFRVRLIAKLFIVLVCAFQIIPRLLVLSLGMTFNSNYARNLAISLSFLGGMISIIAIEYILFKKKGSKVIKYSNVVDLILLVLFVCDWVAVIFSSLETVQHTNPPSFPVSTLYGFTVFAWRTLLVTLIVQKWYLKALPPTIATLVVTGYAIYYVPKDIWYNLLRSISQIVTMVLIFYCEDKLKWRMMWSNVQKEKWIQVNNFILNNIPENIMILDFKGEVRFISDYCKSFMEDCNFVLEKTKDFFKRIQSLHQQQQQNELAPSFRRIGIQIDRLATGNELLREENSSRVKTLQDLITNFKKISEEKLLQEREFLIYNGKLKLEEGEKSIEIKISFVQNLQDEYIILILRDTTQRDLLVALEETNKYKDQLLASVSHELRAPLNGNINLVESAVKSSEISQSVKENLLIPALRSSQFLLHMINDILDMSQIKEKKLRLVFETEDLKETLKNTVQLVELQAKKKGVDLVLELDPQLPQNFCTDHIRLSQIVLNLINNAIKFTKDGGVVKLLAIPMNENCVQISVEDSGIGMTEEDIKKLFSNYTHIEFEGRQKMNPAGVGLGLNIAYNLAELLAPEGQQGIKVKSLIDQGSTFTFIVESKLKLVDLKSEDAFLDIEESFSNSIRIAEESPGIIQPKFIKMQRINSSTSSLGTESCSCPQVLVVDDNPFNTMAFETILSSLEIKCDSVYSGPCAIKKLLSRENDRCHQEECRPYSVVFIDQEMPEVNGSEAVQEIRRLQEQNLISSSTRIIGCTAHHSKEEVEKFMESGLNQCIHKPISPEVIKEILFESTK